jgi:hypothetical protein
LFKKPKNGEFQEKSCFSSVNQPSFFSFLGNLVIYKEDDDRTTDFFQKKLLFLKPKDGEFLDFFGFSSVN